MKELGGCPEIEKVNVDLMGGANRQAPYNTEVNPAGQTPALLLDNGKVLSEVTVISEYLNDIYSGSLFGSTPEEKAETRMWLRRIDFNLEMPTFNGYRFAEGLAMFTPRLKVIPQAADDLKGIAQQRTMWLDGIVADGRKLLCGDRFSCADICGSFFLELRPTELTAFLLGSRWSSDSARWSDSLPTPRPRTCTLSWPASTSARASRRRLWEMCSWSGLLNVSIINQTNISKLATLMLGPRWTSGRHIRL